VISHALMTPHITIVKAFLWLPMFDEVVVDQLVTMY
jgi:hypothetical protein